MEDRLNRLEEKADKLWAWLSDTQSQSEPANKNVNTLKVEGAGSIWNGLTLGVALGAVVMGAAWITSTQQDVRESMRQMESYRAAVYMLAPRFAEEIDKELAHKEKKK